MILGNDCYTIASCARIATAVSKLKYYRGLKKRVTEKKPLGTSTSNLNLMLTGLQTFNKFFIQFSFSTLQTV